MRRASVGTLPSSQLAPPPVSLGLARARRLDSCQAATQQRVCQPPSSPPTPPPLPPPPSPPPPAIPLTVSNNCSTAPCSLDTTLSRILQDDALRGLPVTLQLASGNYTLNSTCAIDANVHLSELRLAGTGGTVLLPLGNPDLFRITDGAPPVLLESVTLRGRVHVDGGTLLARSCHFLEGAALHVDGGSVQVDDAHFVDLRARDDEDGGAIALNGGELVVSDSTFEHNRARRGGAIFASGGVLAVHRSAFRGNQAAADGGAMAVDGNAAVLLTNGTLLQGNVALAGGALSLANGNASLTYGLPAPLGTWVASGAVCQVVAPPQPQSCDPTRFPVALGLTVSVLPPGTRENEDYPYSCPPGIVGDSLEPQAQARPTCARVCPARFYCPLGTVQPLHCISGSFCGRGISYPIPCDPGTYSNATNLTAAGHCTAADAGHFAALGSTVQTPCLAGTYTALERQPSCAKCAAGSSQDAEGATACKACILGYYCEEGASKPLPCPGGTYNDAPGATSKAACIEVTPGFWAPLGSSAPLLCPTSGFRCPGAAYDEKYNGSLPIEVAQGRRRELQNITSYVCTFQLRLALTTEEFDQQRTALKQRLSQLYGKSVAFLLQAGSVVIDVIADFSDLSSMTAFVERASSLTNATLSEELGVETSAPSTLIVTNATVQVPTDATCPAGFYCSAASSYACPRGTWNNLTGQTDSSRCKSCPTPERTTTLSEGAASVDDCVCLDSFYKAANGDCLPCPVGSDCSGPGYALSSIPIRVGYFRPSNESIDIRRCLDASENCGGRDECPESSSGCRGNASEPCERTLNGIMCLLCKEERHFYVRAKREVIAHCEPCSQASSSWWVSTILAFLCVMAAVIIVVLSKKLPLSARRQLGELWHYATDVYGM